MTHIKQHVSFHPPLIYSYLFFGGIFCNVIFPSFFLGIYWHPAMFFSILISVLWAFGISRGERTEVVKWLLFPFFLIFLVFFSDFYGKAFLGVKGDNSALLQVLLLILMFVPYFFALSKMTQKVSDKVLLKVANVSFFTLLLIALLQAWGPQPLSEALIRLYSHEPHTSAALAGFRYTLTGPDPNIGSSIAAFFIILYFVLLMKRFSVKYLFMFIASLVPLFLAQGRTVIIGLAICLFFYFWFVSKIGFFYKLLAFFILVSLVSSVFNVLEVDYLVRGLSELERGESGSINTRLENAEIVLGNFVESPLVGQGANFEQYGLVRYLDSEYLLLLQRHGLLGFLFVLGLIFYMAVISFGALSKYWGSHVLFLLCGLALTVMLTNVFIFNVNTFGYVMIMIYFSRVSRESRYGFNRKYYFKEVGS